MAPESRSFPTVSPSARGGETGRSGGRAGVDPEPNVLSSMADVVGRMEAVSNSLPLFVTVRIEEGLVEDEHHGIKSRHGPTVPNRHLLLGL